MEGTYESKCYHHVILANGPSHEDARIEAREYRNDHQRDENDVHNEERIASGHAVSSARRWPRGDDIERREAHGNRVPLR